MTTLRDLFKKGKKAYKLTEQGIKDGYPKVKEKAKETTDKILDAEIEDTAKKTYHTTKQITKDATWGLVRLSVWVGVIGITFFILYALYKATFDPPWCEKKYDEVFNDISVFNSMNKKELINFQKKWNNRDCYRHIEVDGEENYEYWFRLFINHPTRI